MKTRFLISLACLALLAWIVACVATPKAGAPVGLALTPDPTYAKPLGAMVRINRPLFAPPPSGGQPVARYTDVNQGLVLNDCAMLAPLAALAQAYPKDVPHFGRIDPASGNIVVTFTLYGRRKDVMTAPTLPANILATCPPDACWPRIWEKAACSVLPKIGKYAADNTWETMENSNTQSALSIMGLPPPKVLNAYLISTNPGLIGPTLAAGAAGGKAMIVNTKLTTMWLPKRHAVAVLGISGDQVSVYDQEGPAVRTYSVTQVSADAVEVAVQGRWMIPLPN